MQNKNNNLVKDTDIKLLERAITDHQGDIKKFKTALNYRSKQKRT